MNGKKIGLATTNANGVATVKITSNALKTAKIGKRNMVVVFDGKNYKSASKTSKITITKENVKMVAKAKAFKKSVKTKKYSISLKNSKNKAIKGVKVTIKVKGKTYYAKTNKNGVATFKITKLTKKGKYTATVTYKGNAYYNKLVKKPRITVK